jgi:lysosomal alpha-mannosidase
MQERIQDFRFSWNFTYDLDYQIENITANYYPVDSAIFIENKEIRMTVLTDRTQGGSSLRDGTIELM